MLNILKTKIADSNYNQKGISFFINPYSYLKLRKKKKLLIECDQIFIDGILLSTLLSFSFRKHVERISFDNTGIAPEIFKQAEKNNITIGVVGSSSTNCDGFIKYLKNRYPGLEIAYARHGYFSDIYELEACYTAIISASIELLIVGMGSDLQELFLINLRDKGWKGSAYTCGAFIQQTAKSGHEYYPIKMHKYNLRFLHRILDNPRLLKRYILYYPLFVFVFIYDYIKFVVSREADN